MNKLIAGISTVLLAQGKRYSKATYADIGEMFYKLSEKQERYEIRSMTAV